MADYAPWPLWGAGGMVAEDDLPLSPELKLRIKQWLNAYDRTPQRPEVATWIPPADLSREDQEEAWVAEGRAIRDAIEAELGPDFEVVYET